MKRTNFHKRQQGATLIISLALLMVMTVVGVTATKMSSVETLIAGNEQSKMKLFQETQSELYKFATPIQLLPALKDDTLFVNDVYTVSDEKSHIKSICKLESYTCVKSVHKLKRYECKGIDGLARSVGGPCNLYAFKVKTHTATGGARQESHRGGGKEVPPISPNCLICKW